MKISSLSRFGQIYTTMPARRPAVAPVTTQLPIVRAPPATNTGTTATDMQFATGSSSSGITAAPPQIVTIEQARAEKEIRQVASGVAPTETGLSQNAMIAIGVAVAAGAFWWWKKR